MAYKVYSDGNYIIAVNQRDPDLIEQSFPKFKGFLHEGKDVYTLRYKNSYVSLNWNDALKQDGTPYSDELEFKTFLESNTAI